MKNKRNPMYFAIKAALTTGALIASNSVFAQEDGEDKDSVSLDRVVTIGTHIKATDLETAAPVFSIDREDIARTGLTNVGDLLRQIPSAGASLNLTNNNGGDGSIRVDLRNLGSNRVLVLVNGRRWATTIGGAADLTTIPISVIERIDVLKDGASAVYGSDAIAGVINIVTRSDFEGVEVKGYYGVSGENDGAAQQFNVSMGTASDRGSVFFDASYTKTDPVWAGDRTIAQLPLYGTGNTQGSSGTPQGRFITWLPAVNGWQNVSTTPGSNGYNTPNDPDLIPFNTDARFNYAPDNYLVTPQERTSIFVQGKYQISDNVSVNTEALFNRRESASFLAPTPLFIGAWGGDGIGIGAQNPYNPFGVALPAADPYDPSLPDEGLVFLGRRMVEQGNRKFRSRVDTYHYGLGFEGYIDAGTGWDWSVNYSFTQLDQTDTTEGLLNMDRVANALSDACVTDTACVPFNLFGGEGTITQAMLDYVTFIAQSTRRTKMLTYDAVISSELMELPAGGLGFAAGYEHRRQSGFDQPDALIVSGSTSGNARLATSGAYIVNEFFTELNVPLLSGVAGAEVLELGIAARYSDYDNFGSTTTGKIGLRWKPFEDLLIRATYSEGFRAPNISELFQAAGDSYPGLIDPCNGGGAANPELPGCAGIPSTYNQSNPQIRITVGGNPDLIPEQSQSFTIGAVFEPSFVDNLVFTLDYYDVKIDDVITSIGAGTILRSCAQTGTVLCDRLQRAGSGVVLDIQSNSINANKLQVKGVDFVVTYGFDTDYGLFNINWDTSYTDEYTVSVRDYVNGGFIDINSFDEGVVGDALYRFKSNVTANWSYGDWSVNYQLRHIAGYEQSCDTSLNDAVRPTDDPNAVGGVVPTDFLWCTYASENVDGSNPDGDLDRRGIGAVTYHDLNATYHLAEYDTSFTLGIENMFDKQPPLSANAFANSFDPFTYDGIGRYFYMTVVKRF